jgi:hypothetical protein
MRRAFFSLSLSLFPVWRLSISASEVPSGAPVRERPSTATSSKTASIRHSGTDNSEFPRSLTSVNTKLLPTQLFFLSDRLHFIIADAAPLALELYKLTRATTACVQTT